MLQNSIQYRLAMPGEATEILNIQIEALKHGLALHYPLNVINKWIHSLSNFDYELAIKNQEIYVACINNVIVGFGQYKREWQEIKELYVSPKYLRLGVGSNIMYYLEQLAIKEQVPVLRTFATLNSEKFYKSLGFNFICYKELEISENFMVQFIQMEKNWLKLLILQNIQIHQKVNDRNQGLKLF